MGPFFISPLTEASGLIASLPLVVGAADVTLSPLRAPQGGLAGGVRIGAALKAELHESALDLQRELASAVAVQ